MITGLLKLIPVAKPILVEVGKSAAIGVLVELGFKYGRRICAAQILSQRDRDIADAIKLSKQLKELEAKRENAIKLYGEATKRLDDIVEQNN